MEKMLRDLIRRGVVVKACGSCLNARGLKEDDLVEGVERGSMIGLARWTKESHKLIAF